jgi:hypothetical protein
MDDEGEALRRQLERPRTQFVVYYPSYYIGSLTVIAALQLGIFVAQLLRVYNIDKICRDLGIP